MVAFSDDGLGFDPPVLVAPAGEALATLGEFGDGSLAYTHQRAMPGEPTVSFFQRSADGLIWTEPERVTTASSNVHDTTMVTRLDGDLDLYYIYPAGPQGFVLFRRALTSAGALGAEERVSADALGEPSKPELARLADGRLVLTWAEISQRHPVQGWPTEQRLNVAILTGDAPAAR